jgi:CheY-like chemotaxis protein
MKVLVVEDDREQCRLRAMVLAHSGFETYEACDRRSAGEIAAIQKPEAAVVDLQLPGVNDGLQLLRELKMLDANMHLVVITGSNPKTFESRPEAQLVDRLFTKPMPTASLVDALRMMAGSERPAV